MVREEKHMDLSKAKRMGELAQEIEDLQLSLAVCLSGIENKAWVLEIRATDEGECERSFKLPLPNHKLMVQDIACTPEYLKALDEAGKPRPTMEYRPIRETAIADGRKVFNLLKEIIEEKLAVKHKEMQEL
jgi:hypothetical protein